MYHHSPEYYRGGETPIAGDTDAEEADQLNYYQRSLEGTRRWRALKLWLSWKHLGTDGLGRLVEANDDLAAYLAARCVEADDFEALPAEPELSVVCFRHLPGGAAAAHRLASGPARRPPGPDPDGPRSPRVTPGSGRPRLRGATWLRAGIVNYLATEADIDRILDDLRRLARDEPLEDR